MIVSNQWRDMRIPGPSGRCRSGTAQLRSTPKNIQPESQEPVKVNEVGFSRKEFHEIIFFRFSFREQPMVFASGAG
jgi:hypothetical protein